MGKQRSIRSKAVHFVSDLTTNLLNPISDKPSNNNNNSPLQPPEDLSESKGDQQQLAPVPEDGSDDIVHGPDTSSFTAFLYSLLTPTEARDISKLDDENDDQAEKRDRLSESTVKENSGKKGLFSRGKQSIGRAFSRVTRVGGYRSQEQKSEVERRINDVNDSGSQEMGHTQLIKESQVLVDHPEVSEPSMLLSEKTSNALYSSLPALVKGRRWLLLYSTWRHGISLATLYRRSMLWPGLSLLVVGDSKGAVFGGLVESPLRPNNKRYQGTNSTFVYTNKTGQLVVYRPTGANRYYTLCANDSLAIGGGGHFALYLDSDLLSGSSSVSETYGNPCLAQTEDFQVKDVELWGFVYNSKYDEILKSSQIEAPGICRW